MTSKDKFSKIDQVHFIRKRLNGNAITNNIKSYSIKNLTVEKSVKTTYNTNDNSLNNYQKIQNQSQTSQYQVRTNDKQNLSKDKNNTSYQSKEMTSYGYSLGTSNTSSAINLKHHPNQINNLIHNHRFYTSKTTTTKTENLVKNSKTISSSKTEKSQRTQSLSPIAKNKYEIETRKVAIYGGKQRNSSASNSSGETNVSITKLQLKKLMTNMWLEDIYCSNVESLCCLVENKNSNNNNIDYLAELQEKEIEIENNSNIIKEYENEILKLKSVINMKEQDMKKLMQNLKRSEKELKIKNKQIYELNIKTEKNKEEFDKDTHELQIISKKHEKSNYMNLDKDAHSLQILSMKKGWNETNIPSPINEIYIETVKLESEEFSKKYEEKRRIMKKKEEIIQKKLKKRIKLEIQQMGLLSIISNKPKANNSCQHLGSIMILSKEKKLPLISQKIEEIAIVSHSIKVENEIQELDGLEIINIRKNKELILQEQCLNGLEIHRDYDMLLVKPVWDSLKIQGAGLNLIAEKKEVMLENQEVDEFEILPKKKPENIMEKINNFKITGKIKKVEYKINRERIKLIGLPKEEINWNEINVPIKSSKFYLRRNYDKIEPKVEVNWDDIIRPIKTTKLSVKGKQPKVNIFKVAKRDKFNFLYSSPVKDEYDIENFNINLINSDTKIKTPLKMSKGGFKLKGKEKKKNLLIKNRMHSINLFGLKEKKILFPSLTEQIYLTSELDINLKNWDNINKIIKNRDIKILGKIKDKKRNIISKKEVNIEIKSSKEIILNPIKSVKLFIKGKKKEVIEKPPLKAIKENRLIIKSEKKPEIILKQKKEMKLIIKGIKKEEPIIPDWNDINKFKKENSIKLIGKKIKKINWNDLIKIDKKHSINFIHRVKKLLLKKQNLCSFDFKGIKRIEKKEEVKIKIINTWSSPIKAQRNAKFIIKGKIKSTKLVMSKCGRFVIKKEPEEEIIYNDDYNHLIQLKKENGKEQEKNKILVIKEKEKEITPIFRREIRAQVVKVKDESSETSSQSEVDILGGIKKQQMLSVSSRRELATSGFKKKLINGEVIFTPKNSLGVNLGSGKYKKELMIKKRLNLCNKTHHVSLSGIELSVNNGEIVYEGMSGLDRTIKEGNYKNVNGSFYRGLNEERQSQKILNNTTYKSSIDIKGKEKVPTDSKKKNIKKQLIIKTRMKSENPNEFIKSGNLNNNRIITCENFNENSKKIIYKSNLTNGNIKHSASSFGVAQGKSKIISMKKEQKYFYEHSDNRDLINKNQK